MIGKKFGKLTVINFHHVNKHLHKVWLCKCSCGKETLAETGALTGKHKKSCGCIKSNIEKAEAAAFYMAFDACKRGAITRNLPFNLSFNEWKSLSLQNCFYCGDKPYNKKVSRGKLSRIILYSGIDRLKNEEGYSIDNCVPCCKRCNYWKRASSLEDFLNHVRKIYELQKL